MGGGGQDDEGLASAHRLHAKMMMIMPLVASLLEFRATRTVRQITGHTSDAQQSGSAEAEFRCDGTTTLCQ